VGGLVEVRSDTARARTCFAVGSDTARATARFAAGSDTARATARFAVGSDAARFAADQDSILAMGRFEAHGVMGNVRGNSSAVERQPSKLGVAGSNPVSRSRDIEHRHGFAEPVASVWGMGALSGPP
jgi:hypothetical protein